MACLSLNDFPPRGARGATLFLTPDLIPVFLQYSFIPFEIVAKKCVFDRCFLVLL